ncbi:MAG: oxidoreductase, partial [Pseudonocardiales bacterium]|nr:oxidoreductase [Pseudonocardiales bacterium]
MTRWIAADLHRLGIAEVRELPAMHDDDAWRAGVTDAFHPAGTTRMSVSATDGVVDENLQVHGVNGLHIVGGSVFPIGGYANPTLTIVALAIRLADRVTADAPAILG